MGSFDADDEDDKVEEEEEEEEELALALDSGSDAPFSPQLFGRVRAAVEEESSSFRFAFAGGGVLEFRPLFLFGAMALDTVVVKILVYFLIDLQYFGMSFRCEAEYRQKKGM